MLVEATKMKGRKGLLLTGKRGDLMKESEQIVSSYVQTKIVEWGIRKTFSDYHDIHVYLPSSAIPKDGSSAGVSVATVILSLLIDQSVRQDLGMTEEITLTGRVLPVGRIREKVLAALYADIGSIILPKRNGKDLKQIPESIREKIDLLLVEELNEVFTASIVGTKVQRVA